MENGHKKSSELSAELLNFKEICKPVVEYMQKQLNPHSTIIITIDGAKLVSDEMFVPFKLPKGY